MPDESLLLEETAIPSSKFPSDHIPVYAEFIFKEWFIYLIYIKYIIFLNLYY